MVTQIERYSLTFDRLIDGYKQIERQMVTEIDRYLKTLDRYMDGLMV